MSINCGNKSIIGAHTHETKDEVRNCYGLSSEQGNTNSTVSVTEIKGNAIRALDNMPVTRTKADRKVSTTTTWTDKECVMKVNTITWKDITLEDGTEYRQAQLELSFVNKERNHTILCWIQLRDGGLDIISDVNCKFNGYELMDCESTFGDYRKFVQSLKGKKVVAWVRPERNKSNLLGVSFSTIKPIV